MVDAALLVLFALTDVLGAIFVVALCTLSASFALYARRARVHTGGA